MSRRQGCICLGWMQITDFARFKSEKEVLRALKKAYPHDKEGNRAGAAKSIWLFGHRIQPSHLVIANKGRSSVVGIGVVTSGYLPPKSPENPVRNDEHIWRRHARLVDWRIKQPIDFDHYLFSPPTVHSLSPEALREIRQAYAKKYPKMKETLDVCLTVHRLATMPRIQPPTDSQPKTVMRRSRLRSKFSKKNRPRGRAFV